MQHICITFVTFLCKYYISMLDKKRIVFIVNPISGTTGKKAVERHIEMLLDTDKYDYDIVHTQYAGHASEITRSAVDHSIDIVCAVGGDGTVNEIARSLVGTETALAIIPRGSGNGLARHLHIPIDSFGSIKLINEGDVSKMDYGIINDYPFFCTCGVGFDAFISLKFSQSDKRGPLTYIENVLKNGLSYNPETYDIEIEDENEERSIYKAFLISCANASQYGNNAYIAPQASVHDGLMDVTILEPFTMIEAPQIAIQLFNGTIDQNSNIKTFRCKSMCIHRSHSGVIHYDGDPVMTDKDVHVRIVPAALRCICPNTEGLKYGTEKIQSLITEQFYEMYMRSEELFQNNLRKNQRIFQINKDIIRKLSRKK